MISTTIVWDDLHEEDTMLTIIDEEVLELCTMTVTKTPITSPATGFDSTESSRKMSPAALPIKKILLVRKVPCTVNDKSIYRKTIPLFKMQCMQSYLSV